MNTAGSTAERCHSMARTGTLDAMILGTDYRALMAGAPAVPFSSSTARTRASRRSLRQGPWRASR